MNLSRIDYYKTWHNNLVPILFEWNAGEYSSSLYGTTSALEQLIEQYHVWPSSAIRPTFYMDEGAFMQASLPDSLKPFSNQIMAFTEGVKEKLLTPILTYAFYDRDILTFWVVIQKLDVELEMQYGDVFLDLYRSHPDTKIDLITFGADEFNFVEIPPEAHKLSF